MNGEQVVQILKESLDQIGDDYYINKPTQQELLATHNIGPDDRNYRKLKSFLTYRDERVFCYELYYKVRSRMEQEDDPCDKDALVFQGELRKKEIGVLVDCFVPRPMASLNNVFVPDFILHQRGNFKRQELVIEVKANPTLPIQQFKEDLWKLNKFIVSYNFVSALFLAVNCTNRVIQNRLDMLTQNGWIEANIAQPEKIQVLTKQKRDAPLYECWLNRPTLVRVDQPHREAIVAPCL